VFCVWPETAQHFSKRATLNKYKCKNKTWQSLHKGGFPTVFDFNYNGVSCFCVGFSHAKVCIVASELKIAKKYSLVYLYACCRGFFPFKNVNVTELSKKSSGVTELEILPKICLPQERSSSRFLWRQWKLPAIADRMDSLCMPLMWLHVSWYTYQVSRPLKKNSPCKSEGTQRIFYLSRQGLVLFFWNHVLYDAV
jgi:hypothetical protein